MSSINECLFYGNAADKPELRVTKDGTSVTNVRLAVNEKWKGHDGKQKNWTEWVTVVIWGKMAELVVEQTEAGSPILVKGKWKTDCWVKDDGTKVYTPKLQVSLPGHFIQVFPKFEATEGEVAPGETGDESDAVPF